MNEEEFWKDRVVPITNDFMFGYVMRNPEICKKMIECLLPQVHVAELQYKDEDDPLLPESQKTLQGNYGTHSVRLDVYLDDGHTILNVEMQTGNKEDLPKRVRYYGARIDCDQLPIGHSYRELRPTWVIFICTFDPFGDGLYQYTFENKCQENPARLLHDESYKVFFNANGYAGIVSEDLQKLLTYIRDPSLISEDDKTDLIIQIDDTIQTALKDKEWRHDYMSYEQARQDAIWEGEKKGREEGRVEQAIEIYREMNMDEKTILQKIMSKFNMSLDNAAGWLKKTAEA